MKKYIHNFIHCGILGWCIEIIYTAFHSFRRRELSLKGNTSIWMFPIYGSASLLLPLFQKLKKKPLIARGLIYASLIFGAEYASGRYLTEKNLCPWDYSRSKWSIKKVIRLDYLPFWFLAGLLFERVLLENEK